jgi:hypothetical protein
MLKDYTLRLYSSVLQADPPNFVMDLTRIAQGWRRNIRSNGGYWLGKFVLTGRDATELQSAFETWLGYHVREVSGGTTSWEGMVYEMDLVTNGVRRRRSLDMMSSAVKTTFTKMEYTGENLIRHNSWEYANAGAPNDDFFGWYEANGTGGAVEQTNVVAEVYDGTYAVKLTGDSDGPNMMNGGTYIRQNVQCTPGSKYKLTYWTRGDNVAAGHSGWVGINDPNIGAGAEGDWVINPQDTGVWRSTYVQKELTGWMGPSDGDVQVFFISPPELNQVAFFDKAELYEYQPGVYQTDWQTEDTTGASPIPRYGRKEEIIHLDEYDEDTAIAYKETYWAMNAWPWMRPVSAQPPDLAVLEVSVAGYVFTGNWMYVTEGDGQVHHLGHWISAIVGSTFGLSGAHSDPGDPSVDTAGDCQFLKAGSIDPFDTNTLDVTETTGLEERPIDRIMELANLGDQDGNPWHFAVSSNRLLHYAMINTTPVFYIREDGIFDTMAGTNPSNPWRMYPAVYRDMTYRSGFSEPGSFLPSNQDLYVEEVEMADGWSRPALKTALLGESELLQALMEVALAVPEEPPEFPWPPSKPPEPPGDDRPGHPW